MYTRSTTPVIRFTHPQNGSHSYIRKYKEQRSCALFSCHVFCCSPPQINQRRRRFESAHGEGLLSSSTASMAHCSDRCSDSSWLEVSLSMNLVTNWPNTLEPWYSWRRRERGQGTLSKAQVAQRKVPFHLVAAFFSFLFISTLERIIKWLACKFLRRWNFNKGFNCIPESPNTCDYALSQEQAK